jgi:hypothetical protein
MRRKNPPPLMSVAAVGFVLDARDPLVTIGGTFWRLDVHQPSKPLGADYSLDDVLPAPELAVDSCGRQLQVDLFVPLPEFWTDRVASGTRSAGLACNGHPSSWTRRCRTTNEAAGVATACFRHLAYLFQTPAVYQRQVVPDLVLLAELLRCHNPAWLSSSSSPFTRLWLNLNGVLWKAGYRTEDRRYWLTCFGYDFTVGEQRRMLHGPSVVPSWLLSRCLELTPCHMVPRSNSMPSTIAARNALDLVAITVRLEFWLSPEMISVVTPE